MNKTMIFLMTVMMMALPVNAQWVQTGDNAYTTSSTMKVGIGTKTTASTFHVISSGTYPSRLQSLSTNTFGAGLDFYHLTAPKGYVGVPDTRDSIAPGELLLYAAPGVKATIFSNGQRALTVNTNGNIGIGTTTPAEKLDVAGNIKTSGAVYADKLSATNTVTGKTVTAQTIQAQTVNVQYGLTADKASFKQANVDKIAFADGTNMFSSTVGGAPYSGITSTGKFWITTENSGSPRLIVSQKGLSVSGDVSANKVTFPDGTSMTTASGGGDSNGLWTISPDREVSTSKPVKIQNNVRADLVLTSKDQSSVSVNADDLAGIFLSGKRPFIKMQSDTAALQFEWDGEKRNFVMRDLGYDPSRSSIVINHDKNYVGIGTDNPTAKLDVAGDVKADKATFTGLVNAKGVKVDEAVVAGAGIFNIVQSKQIIHDGKHMPVLPCEAPSYIEILGQNGEHTGMFVLKC